MDIIPPPDYVSVSSLSACGPWSVLLADCYTGNSGRTHCYYDLYYNDIKERGSLYSTIKKDGTYSSYTSTHGDKTLKLTGCGVRCWKYSCATKCQPPFLEFSKITINENGQARIDALLNAGGTTQLQNIDLYMTQVYVYNGQEWFDLSNQLNPTALEEQTTRFSWDVVENGETFIKIKLANSCGYILDWKESEHIIYVPEEYVPPEEKNEIPLAMIGAASLAGLFILSKKI